MIWNIYLKWCVIIRRNDSLDPFPSDRGEEASRPLNRRVKIPPGGYD